MTARLRAIDSQLLTGIALYRAAAWVWLLIVAAVSASLLAAPWLAWSVVGATGLVTIALLRRVWTHSDAPARTFELAIDLAAGVALLVADGWVYEAGRPQALAGAWPVAAVLAIGVARGLWASVAAAVTLGAARFVGLIGMTGGPAHWHGSQWLSVFSTAVLYGLAGAAAAIVAARLRTAEDAVAQAAARDRVARDLHDGMLQTLAAVQRRAADPELVRLARTQEAELRTYLFADAPDATTDLEGSIRRAAAASTARWGIVVETAFVPPLPEVAPAVVEALAAATGECLANAAKHGDVDRVNLSVEQDVRASVLVVVRDRGVGFVPEDVDRRGLATSVGDRIAEVGGTVEIRSAPGHGTDIRLRVPVGGDRRHPTGGTAPTPRTSLQTDRDAPPERRTPPQNDRDAPPERRTPPQTDSETAPAPSASPQTDRNASLGRRTPLESARDEAPVGRAAPQTDRYATPAVRTPPETVRGAARAGDDADRTLG